jgi:hypothetical protein
MYSSLKLFNSNRIRRSRVFINWSSSSSSSIVDYKEEGALKASETLRRILLYIWKGYSEELFNYSASAVARLVGNGDLPKLARRAITVLMIGWWNWMW